ncbi:MULTISPECIES: subclass B3 metallo-beta-lactamase [unclassified Bradyrhizobium]|uniref:subclass B3 metallo-beta-lactamase n=1 Tax=unclassified Bradyrhizobium TaxID=2631580 RepID=UPI001BA6E2FF|nr:MULTISPECIES: subclass B3 metallo-beta-lactamase [unclassified Bradyrhizobium]MBR1226021.1 subclass B3 metallo-beta-lactamase [Bradyrhizobium sp. AUGA SZCCT0176]MBR1238261.1 subclass B3 metallo-beta-lactamase [Bradyrhizobium sp. AUGA SZCCT0182]MBR1283318.1 subclass B3 metallo-beta-lactamase [Bradyrhizobium sp. AUGA SZCCT0177]MBR1302447.1 subclass B3 metallo-beta-lactamase [Bradyrhizobium sp. AUGA SZCCT0042]
MKKLIVMLVALLSLAGAAQAQNLKGLLATLTIAWNKPTEPFKIIGNVYYVGTHGLASYLITTPQGHILVDTVMPEATSQIKGNIEKLGFKVTDIKYLLNTHAHIDHTGGLAEMKAASGAQLVAGEADKPLLEGGYYPGAREETLLNFPPVKVDRTMREGDTITLGDVKITARETPGHSPGCTSWEFSVKDNNVTRSVLIFCSGTVALNRLVTNPTYPGIVADYRKTFARARGMKVDVLLAPHPEMYKMAEKRAKLAEGGPNPFVNPGEFNDYAATLEKAFEEGLAKQTAAAQEKKG